MHLLVLLTAALATAVSATEAVEETTISARNIGVTFYEHIHWNGFSFAIPTFNRCWRLPDTLFQKASSVRFQSNDVTCALYRNGYCLPPAIYAGLRESVRNFHDLGLGDEIGSVYCGHVEH